MRVLLIWVSYGVTLSKDPDITGYGFRFEIQQKSDPIGIRVDLYFTEKVT